MKLDLILKMLGVKVAPETVAQIEAVLPQLPSKIQEVIAMVNTAIQQGDKRLWILEEQMKLIRVSQEIILEAVLNGRTDSGGDTRPAGIGATERAAVERIANGRSD